MRTGRVGFRLLAAVGVVAVVAHVGFGVSLPSRGSAGTAVRAGSAPRVSAPSGTTPAPRFDAIVHRPSGRPLRILTVGASVGVTFARGMKLWARAHDAQVVDDSLYWCPLGRWLPYSPGIGILNPGIGCSNWATRWATTINSFDPDVVFVYYSIWEISPRRLPGHTDLLQPGSRALDAWQLSEYRAAADVLGARGAQVVWFTIPCENEPILDGSPLWYVNRRTIPALAASRPAVHVIDLDHELCAAGPTHAFGGIAQARPDGAHYSDHGALAVANWVMPIVLGQAANPKTVDEMNPPPSGALTQRAG